MDESKPGVIQLVRELAGRVRGAILQRNDPEFENSRRLWNAAIDRHPAVVVVCADDSDVALALGAAHKQGLRVTVRAGGHNAAGRALADGAVLLDLSRMRQVSIDEAARTAIVQGGALWRDVDAATAQHGLATTGGMISSTGVGGLTLGGGAGWLMRRHGLAIDNLVGARVTLADGRVVTASIEENADLFYGLRGGAGGFGVVTSFDFKLHPIREVLAGVVVRPAAETRAVLREFRDFALQASDDYCGMVVLTNAPPFPFLDATWHGRPVAIQAMCWSGDAAAGHRALESIRRSGTTLGVHVDSMPYMAWQQAMDKVAPAGRHVYWKTASYRAFSDATIEVLAQAVHNLPSPLSELHVQHLGGAVARVSEADTAFSSRDAQFFVNLLGFTESKDEFAGVRAKIRELYAKLIPESLPSLLPNFMNEDDGDATARFAAQQRERIRSIRRKYDPTGMFANQPQ